MLVIHDCPTDDPTNTFNYHHINHSNLGAYKTKPELTALATGEAGHEAASPLMGKEDDLNLTTPCTGVHVEHGSPNTAKLLGLGLSPETD